MKSAADAELSKLLKILLLLNGLIGTGCYLQALLQNPAYGRLQEHHTLKKS